MRLGPSGHVAECRCNFPMGCLRQTPHFVSELHRLVLEDFKPNITLLLDLSPRVGLTRAWKQIDNGTRCGSESRFEEETLSFHEKVRAG